MADAEHLPRLPVTVWHERLRVYDVDHDVKWVSSPHLLHKIRLVGQWDALPPSPQRAAERGCERPTRFATKDKGRYVVLFGIQRAEAVEHPLEESWPLCGWWLYNGVGVREGAQ